MSTNRKPLTQSLKVSEQLDYATFLTNLLGGVVERSGMTQDALTARKAALAGIGSDPVSIMCIMHAEIEERIVALEDDEERQQLFRNFEIGFLAGLATGKLVADADINCLGESEFIELESRLSYKIHAFKEAIMIMRERLKDGS